MRRTAKPREWIEISRRATGNFYLHAGTGAAGDCSYFALEYEVHRTLPPESGKHQPESSRRCELGRALYLHEHPELALAFAVASPAVGVLRAAAKKLEGRR